MRKSLAVLVVMLVAMSAPAMPASAHNWDGNSLHACYSQREWAPISVVRHSHPSDITSLWVDYYCCEWDGARHQYYYTTLWANGATNRHGPESGPYLGDCP